MGSSNAILVAPPNRAMGYAKIDGIKVAIATGWKRFIPNMGIHMHISDHVDNDQLINFIYETKAKKIVTFHGGDKELKKIIAAREQLKLNF